MQYSRFEAQTAAYIFVDKGGHSGVREHNLTLLSCMYLIQLGLMRQLFG
jgi:hypothetical protein